MAGKIAHCSLRFKAPTHVWSSEVFPLREPVRPNQQSSIINPQSSILARSIEDWGLLPCGGVGFPHASESVDVVSEAHVGIAGILVVAVARATVLGTESPRAAAE